MDDNKKIRFMSIEMVSYLQRESHRLTLKYKNSGAFFHVSVFKDALRALRRNVDDVHPLGRNLYFLFAWEIMLTVCENIGGEPLLLFPHLVVGRVGQGLLDERRGGAAIYKRFLTMFDET